MSDSAPASLSAADTAAEEIQWLARIGRGDREALRQLYSRYSAALFSLAVRFLGSKSDAEEAVQDTFLKIWRHAATYDAHQSRPFTWAVTILRRTCIDYLRKHQRTPFVAELPDQDSADLATPETIRATTETREASARLRAALTQIARPQRDALELALYSTLTQAEIAARLAQPIGTVKSWIRRGLLDLRANLQLSAP